MSAKVEDLKRDDGIRTLMFECPGCDMMHQVNVAGSGRPMWTWNGSIERPTFSPSVLVTYDHMSEAGRARSKTFHEKHGRYPTHEENPYDVHDICHSFVTDGHIQFLGDCTHKLAGQTVDLPEIGQ
jgi:hypothetical protein